MEEGYAWETILKISAPVAAAEAYIFYTNISDGWKIFSLISGVLLTGAIVYTKDRKKNNIFTAAGIVLLAALAAKLLKGFGLF